MKIQLLKIILGIVSFIIFPALATIGQTESFIKDGFKITQETRTIGQVKIVISQKKSLTNTDPLCAANIKIFRDTDLLDSLNIPDDQLDAVGDRYGLFVYDELIKNHLVISKFGSYDGQTIFFNSKGQKFITLGGFCYPDKENGLMFSIYHSDIAGFSVFDLNTDKELFSITMNNDRVREFYLLGNKYFMRTERNNSTQEKIWEIDLEKQKITESKMIRALLINPIKELSDYSGTKIHCE